jgi:predicted RNA-binding protein YlqC (UPF0109 family)
LKIHKHDFLIKIELRIEVKREGKGRIFTHRGRVLKKSIKQMPVVV